MVGIGLMVGFGKLKGGIEKTIGLTGALVSLLVETFGAAVKKVSGALVGSTGAFVIFTGAAVASLGSIVGSALG
jgi:hypothetical protein